MIGISIYVVLMPEEQAEKLESYGYLGTFLISILANATLLIPVPGLVIVFSMGAKFNPLLIGVAAGAGATIGELSGYLAGFSGQGILENQKYYNRMVSWMREERPFDDPDPSLLTQSAFRSCRDGCWGFKDAGL